MLGKLIKNEFINRGKSLLVIAIGMFGLSIFTSVIMNLDSYVIIDSTYFDVFAAITACMYIVAFGASIIGLIFMSVGDFDKRFFREQGYLTHTLPVSTFMIIIARMIYDLVMVLGMAVFYPLSITIVTGDLGFYEKIIDMVWKVLSYNGTFANKMSLIVCAILMVIAVFIGILMSLWHFNVAYAIGSMFNKSKKIVAIVSYVVIYIAMEVIVLIISYIISSLSNDALLTNIIYDIDTGTAIGEFIVMLLMMNILMIIGIASFAIITNQICKHKLNLE